MYQKELELFDVCIIGGGLAGLCSAIELSKKGFAVALIEKKEYPFHKVCGEYISLESWDYLEFLGLDLKAKSLPIINKLHFSTESGKEMKAKLPLGGFGISRYTLDGELAEIAKKIGVHLFEKTTVRKVEFEDVHSLQFNNGNSIQSRVVIGAFGKRSNLDLSLERNFLLKRDKNINFIGVKYHIKADLPEDQIGLHLFENGYCGVSKVDLKNTYCMCYLTIAENLKKYGSIDEMENKLFKRNKNLSELLKYENLYQEPLTISQISFHSKAQIVNHILMAGDAAGLITPLSGNGMSMAMNAAHILSSMVEKFLKGKINRKQLEENYSQAWNKLFAKRLYASRKLQTAIYNEKIAGVLVGILNRSEFLRNHLISLTHGKPFYKP